MASGTKKKDQNVLLVVIDQFRADLLGDEELGRLAHLPNLRSLTEQAVSFLNHFTVTVPCGPSRASLFTGQYAFNHGSVRNGTPLRHDIPNLAETARNDGFDPLLFGYTDITHDPRKLAPDDPRLASYEELLPGFDEVLRMRMESDDSAWRKYLEGKGIDLPPYPENYRPVGPDICDPAQYSAEDSDTAFLTNGFLAKMKDQQPGWFAALTYIRPHPPLVAPAPYNRLYSGENIPKAASTLEPGGDEKWHPFMSPAIKSEPANNMAVGFEDITSDPDYIEKLRAVYLGLATEVDHHIGRIIQWLKDSGQWDNTLLVVTSDHGEMLGDFGLWGKSSFYDAAYHVPLIIRDPDQPDMHGAIHSGFTESIDVPVTILEKLGCEVPSSMNGKSLRPLLENPEQEGAQYSLSEFDFGNPLVASSWMSDLGLSSREANLTVLRTPNFRLVEFAGGLPPIMFDMTKDKETRSVAGKPDMLSLQLELTQQVMRLRMKNADPTFGQTLIRDGVKTGTL
ncbi:MAG: sulfatase-like hydrolase/transferase [Paracoccaceae bacterium]